MTSQSEPPTATGHTASFTAAKSDKDEKIAAAKLKVTQFHPFKSTFIPYFKTLKKLKKFKKEKTSQNNNESQQTLHVDTAVTSGRSTPSSSYSQPPNNSDTQQKSPYPYTSLTDTVPFNNHTDYLKQQLQLHVQTIGVLVAEKTELHSKLQQTILKCDRIQDENDELLGRLKASRQKIADLERLVQSQHEQISSQSAHSFAFNSSSNSPTFDSEGQRYIERLKAELNSSVSVNEELRLRLNESVEAGKSKEQEAYRIQRENLDLKSELELMQLKFQQFSSDSDVDKRVESYLSEIDQQEMNSLKERNVVLEGKLAASEEKLLGERERIKQEYQAFASQLQQQVESLVDQINRMTDEREASFSKLDSLEMLLNKSNKQNDVLIGDLNEMRAKYEEALVDKGSRCEEPVSNKEQLLENELKYFKQQIEILVEDHNGLIKLIEEKEQEIVNLNKLVLNYENERSQHAALVEQSHNDRQALSRALQQNKDLKKQLEELQDAFVSVTQQNLDLTTRLQAEEFRQKQTEVVGGGENEENSEWGDEVEAEGEAEKSQEEIAPNLMDGVKKRIQDLEKENKDLNDYITLVNKSLEKKQAETQVVLSSAEQEEIIDRQLKKIEDLGESVRRIEVERDSLAEKVKELEISSGVLTPESVDPKSFANFKLLEDKFIRVIAENADLKEKNQELDHVVMQLQCETDTIVDYITMYQMERKKLNQKYKEKDESIRSLSTQLQINKLALFEISNYLGKFKNYSEPECDSTETPVDEDSQKKAFLLNQMEKILGQLTSSSTNTLNSVTAAIVDQKKSQEAESNGGVGSVVSASKAAEVGADGRQPFRSKLVVCSCCDGELFIV